VTTLDTELAPVLPLTGQTQRVPKWKKRSTWVTVIWAAALIVLVAVVLYPLVWMVLASFKPSADINGNVALFPENPTIQNYVKVLQGIGGIPVWTFFANSLILAIGSVIGVVISSSMAAYAFARVRFAGSKLFFGLMIATLLLPFHVLIIPQYIIFQRLGLVDTFVPLLVVKFLATEAFFVFLMVQFIRNLPMELDEAARIDGAGHPRVFFSITLPLIKPALVTSSIFAFIWSWNDFLGPLLYLNSTDKYPLPLALRLYNDQTSVSDYGATIAISVLALIPIALFFFIFQRFLVEGVATQGLKG
jgi:multiple sugar transport system permease protein